MKSYYISDKIMKNRFGLDMIDYLEGLMEGCKFNLYLSGKLTKNWKTSYDKLVKGVKDSKKLSNKEYEITVLEIVRFKQVINADPPIKI